MTDATPLIPLAELADTFRRSARTLYRWAAAGELPAEKIGGTWYMRVADVEEYTHPRAKMRAETNTRIQEGVIVLDAETALMIADACRDAMTAIVNAQAIQEHL